MRVIGGEAKGRRLKVPRGRATRPTADLVRESLFNILAPRVAGARVLDLFAGSGGVGIEALSRGASEAVFVESDPRALAALKENLDALGLVDRARVIGRNAVRALEGLRASGERFDLIFADPPYHGPLAGETLAALTDGALLTPHGVLVMEHFAKHPLPKSAGVLRAVRTRRFGESSLTFFRPIG